MKTTDFFIINTKCAMNALVSEKIRFRVGNIYRKSVLKQHVDRNTIEDKKIVFLAKERKEVIHYISEFVNINNENVIVEKTSLPDEIQAYEQKRIQSFINLQQTNNFRYINKYFNKVNDILPFGGLFIGKADTLALRKKKIFSELPRIFAWIYWIYAFIFHRVISKIRFTRKVYFFLTKGKYRWMSRSEILGRLVSCGFDIIEHKEIEGKIYFVVMKTRKPDHNFNVSYGPLFKMSRIGKDGKIIRVYKFRTMHPYSEYLQDYVLKLNGYSELGKPKDDFRLAGWGKFIRKYWLDELPQFINVIKGEMKLVGVRPLSKTRFKQLPEEVQKLRITDKPGCFPPYVALCMPDAVGNIEAEKIYFDERNKHPNTNDFRFLLMALKNILVGKIKSE